MKAEPPGTCDMKQPKTLPIKSAAPIGIGFGDLLGVTVNSSEIPNSSNSPEIPDSWDDDDDQCSAPECDRCGDTGKIIADDGFHEYLGYTDMPCPNCQAGMRWIGILGPTRPVMDA